jgi:hypothetical protein
MKLINKTLVLMLLFVGSSSFAYQYGMAGCGLGTLVFKDQPGKIQIVAATLNDILVPQTSAITTGSSNCYEASASDAANHYIESNGGALQKDISQGQGETLTGLLTIWGCSNVDQVGSTLQSNYQDIYSSANASHVEIGNSLKKVIRQNNNNTCTTLI